MDEKVILLIKKLIDTVDYPGINWEEGSRTNQYTLNIGKGLVMISYLPGGDGECYEIDILNEFGVAIESAVVTDYYRDPLEEDVYGDLKNLYTLVDRKVRNIDGIIDSMLKELDSKFPI